MLSIFFISTIRYGVDLHLIYRIQSAMKGYVNKMYDISESIYSYKLPGNEINRRLFLLHGNL